MLAGFVMVTVAAASWGTWSLFLRPTGLPAIVVSPIIFGVITIVTLPFALRGKATWDRKTAALVVANAAFDALNIIAFFGAISTTTVAIAVLTHYVAPIMIAIAAPWIDGVRTRGVVPAAVVALAGLVIVLEPWSFDSSPAGSAAAHGALVGSVLGVLSAACYAGNVFVVRRLVLRIGATKAMAYHSAIAAVVLAPVALVHIGDITPGDVALLAAGSATIGAASGIVFAIGLARIGSARTAVLTFAEPLVAVAVGALVWDEPLHPVALAGGALVLGAGIHVARQAR